MLFHYDYRNLFNGLNELVPLNNGYYTQGINFDNAATTPPFKCVLDSVVKFSYYYSSIHRGNGYKSKICSDLYEEARKVILDFVNADKEKYTVIFVKNATEGINKLSYRLIGNREEVVLSSFMEHHSNDLPWRGRCKVDYIDIDDKGRLSIDSFYEKLKYYKEKVKYVTITGASNVTGYVNDIHKISAIAHEYGAKVIVDGAQLVPHRGVNMCGRKKDEFIDYLVFSAHKMYAPFGIGAIVAPVESFQKGAPEYSGGGTVKFVSPKEVVWEEAPHREEAGTPNLMGVIALLSAIQKIKSLGMENIEEKENSLTEYALNQMVNKDYITIYGDETVEKKDRVGIIAFNMEGIDHYDVSEILSSKYGIAVRNGCFCAQPYVQKLLKLTDSQINMYRSDYEIRRPGMVRVSFGIYNNFEEIDKFIKALEEIYHIKE